MSLGQVLCPHPAPEGTFPAPRLSFPVCKMGRIILPYLTRSWLSGGARLCTPRAAGSGHCQGRGALPAVGAKDQGTFLAPPDSIESPDEQCLRGAGV